MSDVVGVICTSDSDFTSSGNVTRNDTITAITIIPKMTNFRFIFRHYLVFRIFNEIPKLKIIHLIYFFFLSNLASTFLITTYNVDRLDVSKSDGKNVAPYPSPCFVMNPFFSKTSIL